MRSFTLNDDADSKNIVCDLVDGVLTVKIPKCEPSYPEVIDVHVNYGGGVTLTTSELSDEVPTNVSSETTPSTSTSTPTKPRRSTRTSNRASNSK